MNGAATRTANNAAIERVKIGATIRFFIALILSDFHQDYQITSGRDRGDTPMRCRRVRFASKKRKSPCYSVDERLRKRPCNSPNGVASANAANDPRSLISLAARRKPPQAARANAPPTEMRRTPRSASCATVRSQLFEEIKTFTGFGATALTICAFSSTVVAPGA